MRRVAAETLLGKIQKRIHEEFKRDGLTPDEFPAEIVDNYIPDLAKKDESRAKKLRSDLYVLCQEHCKKNVTLPDKGLSSRELGLEKTTQYLNDKETGLYAAMNYFMKIAIIEKVFFGEKKLEEKKPLTLFEKIEERIQEDFKRDGLTPDKFPEQVDQIKEFLSFSYKPRLGEFAEHVFYDYQKKSVKKDENHDKKLRGDLYALCQEHCKKNVTFPNKGLSAKELGLEIGARKLTHKEEDLYLTMNYFMQIALIEKVFFGEKKVEEKRPPTLFEKLEERLREEFKRDGLTPDKFPEQVDQIKKYLSRSSRLSLAKYAENIFYKYLGDAAEKDNNRANKLHHDFFALCKEHCKNLPFPEELSSSALDIVKEKVHFYNANKIDLYKTMVYFLQIAMLEKFMVEKFRGEKFKKPCENYAEFKDGIYICLSVDHTKTCTVSHDDKLNFMIELEGFSLMPEIFGPEKNISRIKNINWLNKWITKDPNVIIYRLDIPPEEYIKACKAANNIPDAIPDLKDGHGSANPPQKTIGWGYIYGPKKIPSQRNCHAFVYSALRHLLMSKELTKDVDESATNVIKEQIIKPGRLY